MSIIMSNISKGTSFLAQGVTNCLRTERVEANGLFCNTWLRLLYLLGKPLVRLLRSVGTLYT